MSKHVREKADMTDRIQIHVHICRDRIRIHIHVYRDRIRIHMQVY